MASSDDRLIWLDLEMNGLDLEKHTIVEIAVATSDWHCKNYKEGPDIVIHHSQDVIDNMNEWCVEHHTKSGLITQILSSHVSLYDAESAVIEFLSLEQITPGLGILGGNSVFVDRWFIQKHMPRLAEYLSKKIIDCSTIKELILRWQPLRFRKVPYKQMKHRASDDIRESINELKYYYKHMFISSAKQQILLRSPPYEWEIMQNPKTHIVWLKINFLYNNKDFINDLTIIITDGNLNLINELYIENISKSNSQLLIDFLHKNILVNRISPLAGEFVDVDRVVMSQICPDFVKVCHYRNIDVDIISTLCSKWFPNVYKQRPIVDNSAQVNSRPKLKSYIELLKYYRANIFRQDMDRDNSSK
ncbi:unnamed protein product [Didymodactylos carnosus]|uniref:Exonuclease domain-containing protein n=1 Tax=Didymodactylos carnosus TaxID=1234261 RepID=A0A813UE16_9BILA|nr:unnamed protein product [Didymodactylos carnosus]CAF1005307.1 unnamed protein product [Didymodactylos carnosus]CAF3611254.1 unnamed protein product [Didymodactylos carnosus]CAF3774474.1 unnamed protein product [Didymodactylos carnosus]